MHCPISIHALRKESDRGRGVAVVVQEFISIHALRKESDEKIRLFETIFREISIHALRKESDNAARCTAYIAGYFNPRSPQGERHIIYKSVIILH